MALCDIKYVCLDCGKEKPDNSQKMICVFCGGPVRGDGMFSIIGSRDNFGIKCEFRDDETGKSIDNWRSWEKAGYRDPLQVTRNDKVKAGIKRKKDKIKHDNWGEKFI